MESRVFLRSYGRRAIRLPALLGSAVTETHALSTVRRQLMGFRLGNRSRAIQGFLLHTRCHF
jgi:hypothetical protein